MKAKTMAGLVLLTACAGVWAQDLGSVYQDALANDAQYRAARAQYASVEERVPQSRAALRPAISLSANANRNDANGTGISAQQYNSGGYTLSLTQPLFRRQSVLSLDQSQLLLEQAKAQLEQARQELLIRTAQAYFDVLLARDSLNAIKTQRAANLELSTQARRSFEIGTVSITDVRDAKARYDIVTAQEISAGNELNLKVLALRQIINKDPGSLAPLRSGLVLQNPVPGDMQAWVQAAQTSGAAVLAARAAVEAARLETAKAHAAHLPTLDLTASKSSERSGSITTIGNNVYSKAIGFQLSLPIYSGGGTVAHERELLALQDKSEAELDGARRIGTLMAQQAYLGVTSGLAQVQALEESLLSARTALDANKRGVEVGTRINIDVLNAQQQLAVTERDLAKARYDTLMSQLKLKAAAGSVGESDVHELAQLLIR
jgi:outer membrane protein